MKPSFSLGNTQVIKQTGRQGSFYDLIHAPSKLRITPFGFKRLKHAKEACLAIESLVGDSYGWNQEQNPVSSWWGKELRERGFVGQTINKIGTYAERGMSSDQILDKLRQDGAIK